MRPTDVKVREVELFFDPQRARYPLKFGAVVMDHVTLCRARAVVETASGKVGEGWGAMFLAHFWSWPDPSVPIEAKEEIMRRTARAYADAVQGLGDFMHPVDIFFQLEDELRRLSSQISREVARAEQPFLGALVCASPIDAAIHDAFGIANGISSYDGYGPDFMDDLSKYLGPDFRGAYISDFIRDSFVPELPVFHLVGGLDKLTRSELDDSDPADGLPNCLEDWIARDGVFCLKVKLRGNDLDWDVERMIAVHDVAGQALARLGIGDMFLSADTNEQCESPEYVVEMLEKIRERSPSCFERILYVEQPTSRDLAAAGHDMRQLARIKPVLVDESLTDLESFELALQQGWSGIALKACKCHSAALVMAAKAREQRVPYSIQDLTNPSLALFHSVGLAARLHPIKGVEANSRQYFPDATSPAERHVHAGIFYVRRGYANTWSLQGPGLGFQMDLIRRTKAALAGQ